MSALGTKRERAATSEATTKKSSLHPSDATGNVQLPSNTADDSFLANVVPKQPPVGLPWQAPSMDWSAEGPVVSDNMFVGRWSWEPAAASSDPARDLAAKLDLMKKT